MYEKNRVEEANRDRRDGPSEADVNRSYNELFYVRGTKLVRAVVVVNSEAADKLGVVVHR